MADANDLQGTVQELRNQGLTDTIILQELTNQGYAQEDVQAALAQAPSDDMPAPPGRSSPSMEYGNGGYPSFSQSSSSSFPMLGGQRASGGEDGNVYERMEEIAENLIDEKWEELLAEVRKIVAWKEKVEERQTRLASEVEKLKEDFTGLHQGVLGKLEDYDERMRDVGTELKAVGKVFKDVVPEFVENVKELSSLKNELRERK